MTDPQEWLPVAVIQRRLWLLAKYPRADVETAVHVRELIPHMISAYVRNWHDGEPPMNDAGVRVMDWRGMLQHVRRVRPDIWPVETSRDETPGDVVAKKRCGPEKGKGKYVEADRALYAKMDALIKLGNTPNSAAWMLEDAHEIADPDVGTPKSRVTRLARRYSKERKTSSN